MPRDCAIVMAVICYLWTVCGLSALAPTRDGGASITAQAFVLFGPTQESRTDALGRALVHNNGDSIACGWSCRECSLGCVAAVLSFRSWRREVLRLRHEQVLQSPHALSEIPDGLRLAEAKVEELRQLVEQLAPEDQYQRIVSELLTIPSPSPLH